MLIGPASIVSGNADKRRTEKPLVIGITGQDDLGDGAGLVVTGINYEHSLVLMRVELIAERGMDLSDAVSGEGVLQRSFARGYASQ